MKLSSHFSEQGIGYQRSLQQIVGFCQIILEQFEAGILSYFKALELIEKSPEDQDTKDINKGDIMQNIATGYEFLNNPKEAIVWYTKSLDIKQKREDSPSKNYAVAKTLIGIGNCYQELGEFQKALDEYYGKAREKLQEYYPFQETRKLKSWLFHNEGLCHYGLGHYKKALDAYENALAIHKQINAPGKDMAKTINNIANVLSKQGRHKEAIEKYMESLKNQKETSGQDAKNLGIASALHNIGNEYLHLKHYQGADKWLREALSMKQIVYHGKNHPNTSFTLNSIGLNYRHQGDLEKAKDYFIQAYDMILTCEGNDKWKEIIKRNLDEVEEKLQDK